jgi:predicted methyltransferase
MPSCASHQVFRVSPAIVALAAVGLLAACGKPAPQPPASDVLPAPAAGVAQTATPAENVLAGFIAGDQRSPDNRARDQYRHPQQTLEFFGLRPEMTVLEIWPSGGWWTEILAPYLRTRGRYIAAGPDPNAREERTRKALQAYRDKLAARPDLYDKVELAVLAPPDKLGMVPPDSVDMIVTFRNIHNWMGGGDAEKVFAAFYKALKPGGVLGVEEHRAKDDKPQDPKAKSGYVRQDYAIALAKKAGFVLEESSEINANPKDTKDYPGGVWTLPPTLAEKDKNREKYLAIGESDRFTLRFRKPTPAGGVGEGQAPATDEAPSVDGGETPASPATQ